jgi:hypothetical protein
VLAVPTTLHLAPKITQICRFRGKTWKKPWHILPKEIEMDWNFSFWTRLDRWILLTYINWIC